MKNRQFVLIGNSLIADFDWQARMPFFKVADFGTPGETTQDLLEKLPSIIEKLNDPVAVVVVCGTNNVVNGDYDFIDSLEQIVVKLTNAYPETEIIVNSLFPINVSSIPREKIVQINTDIESLTKKTGSTFLNMFKRFESSDANLILEDGIQLSEKAYDFWARSISEYLAFLVE